MRLEEVCVNGRVLSIQSNGQRRVAEELISRFPGIKVLQPGNAAASGMAGHLWEQAVLPIKAFGRPLWSPSTSGPIVHPNHIVTVHDIAFVDGPQWFSKSFATLYDVITRNTVKTSRHIVTVSEFTRQRLIEHYRAREDKLTTVYSGKSSRFFRRGREETAAVLESFDLLDKRYVIAFAGTDPRKNTSAILEAWKAIQHEFADARLVLFGRAANPKVFARMNGDEDVGGIVRVGAVSDDALACLFSEAQGFVFPSIYEGFGLPIIEAAACGCRILASVTSSMPEVSPPDAVLVDPLSLEEIKNGMKRFLLEEKDELASGERIGFAQRFDWDVAAGQYMQIFEKEFR